jgi:hypothetical protein
MSETKDLIEQLNLRVDKLISRIAESNQLAERRQSEILLLTEQLRQKDQVISLLRTELTVAQEAKENAVTLENEQLKGRINEMVREIDECISLLKVGN